MGTEEAVRLGLRECPAVSPEEARQLNPLRLAYLGDVVWELLIRARTLEQGLTVRHMHQTAVAGVNAAAQAGALEKIAPLLTDAETDMVRRGRNAHPHHAGPRHQEAADYKAATGLETLIGYLYWSGQEERLMTLFRRSQEEDACPERS